jgi:hypothetical protein
VRAVSLRKSALDNKRYGFSFLVPFCTRFGRLGDAPVTTMHCSPTVHVFLLVFRLSCRRLAPEAVARCRIACCSALGLVWANPGLEGGLSGRKYLARLKIGSAREALLGYARPDINDKSLSILAYHPVTTDLI